MRITSTSTTTSVFILVFCLSAWAKPQEAVVIVPVTDVWSRPLAPGTTGNDAWRETQVLFGEKVLIHESSGAWVRIEATEQPEFTHNNKWEGYPGWVGRDTVEKTKVTYVATLCDDEVPVKSTPQGNANFYLPMGSKVDSVHQPENSWGPFNQVRISKGKKHWIPRGAICARVFGHTDPVVYNRLEVIHRALMFLSKTPYQWGGLTSKGLDCSGLVHLVYRISEQNLTPGFNDRIPRDSHEQWMKAKPIKRNRLHPADLIFSAKADNPKKITHVTIYADNEEIVEAPQTGMAVRKISFQEKYGKSLSEVESGDTVGDRVIYFGTFLTH